MKTLNETVLSHVPRKDGHRYNRRMLWFTTAFKESLLVWTCTIMLEKSSLLAYLDEKDQWQFTSHSQLAPAHIQERIMEIVLQEGKQESKKK